MVNDVKERLSMEPRKKNIVKRERERKEKQKQECWEQHDKQRYIL